MFAAIVNVSLKATIYAHCSDSSTFIFFPFLHFSLPISLSSFPLFLLDVTFPAAPLNYSAHDSDVQVFFHLTGKFCLKQNNTEQNYRNAQ
jgi:hypothetical protein